MQTQPVDGGANYYGAFANPLPSDPSYFPIGGWLRKAESQANFDAYRDFGMNLFVGVEAPEFTNESLIRQAGMRTLIQANERTRFDDIGPENAGWLLADEIDMTGGPSACTGSLQTIKNGLPADGKARYNNYGKGVLLWQTDAEASCFVNAQDITSSDLYWFTDPNQANMFGEPWLPEGERQMTEGEVRRAANYGYQVDRMRALDARDGRRQPIWNFVELGWPFTESAAAGGRRILPAELRAAVWHSIIAGARGIVYFDHNFNGPCGGSTILGQCYPDTRAAARSVNQQIQQLAPDINSPTVTGGFAYSGGVRAMAKLNGSRFTVFAGSRANVSSTATFNLPVGNTTATVVGEGRTIPVTNGSFTDSFANGNAIHIYRIGT